MNAEKFKIGTPMLVFLLLALAIAGRPGYSVFQQHTRQLKEDGKREMFTIANLKAERIVLRAEAW